jgi:hypothetical protein
MANTSAIAVSAFSPPDKQVDRGVLLARRLRHDLDAGIEDLVAGQDQARFAAAEELREQRAEMRVDRVVGLLQLLARFAVDAADGVFQRADGLAQVGRLRVEEALALGGRGQFFQRRQIDRAERLDLGRERAMSPCRTLSLRRSAPPALSSSRKGARPPR